MIKFKTILFFILLSVFTKVLFAANGKQIKHDVIDEEIAVFVDRKIVDLNLQAAFDKLIRSLALSRACNRTGGPVNITFTGIQYNMIQHKYSYNVSGYIRTLLQRQSIPNVVFLNRASALIKWTMEQNRLKRNGTISGQPRKFESADYILSGYLYGLSRKSNMYYRFSLRLTDISRGGIVWEDDYEVSLPVYQISSCEISHDGSYVAVAGEDSQLTIWDLYSGTIDFSTGCNVRCVSFLPDSSILALGTDKGSLLLYNIESNEELWKFEKLFSLTVFSPNINFSRCGKYILANGVILNASSGFPLGIDTNYNTLWRKKLTKGIICSLNGEQLILTQEGYYKGSKNKSDFVCYLDKSLLTNIDWSSEYIHNLKAEGEANGTVVLRRKDTDKEIARLMHFTDGEWLIITPEGYYNSSEKGDMYINVRIGGGVYGVDNFREKFYRPDLVRLALAGRSLKRFRSIETVNQSPIISFVDTPSGVNINEVTVTVKLQDIGGGIGNVRFYINGCAVLQDKNTAEGVAGKSVTKKIN